MNAVELSALGVLALAGLHVVAGYLHGGAEQRPWWLTVGGGISIAYVFVHLLPELAEQQAGWLEVRADRRMYWFEGQIYVATLLGVILALGLERVASSSGGRQFWLQTTSFAVYNALIGGFALKLSGVIPLVLAIVAFGAHFLINDHHLHVRYGRAYERRGRWVLASSIVVGWLLAVAWQPPAVFVAVVLSVVAGGIVINTIKEELPERDVRRFVPWVVGAIGYAGLLVVLTYFQRTAEGRP